MFLGLFIYIISNLEIAFWTENVSTEHIITNMLYRGVSISVYYVALANITYTTLKDKLEPMVLDYFNFLELWVLE